MDRQPGSYKTAAKGKPQRENLNDEAMAARLGVPWEAPVEAETPVEGMDRQPSTYKYDINKKEFVPNIVNMEVTNNES